MENLFKKAADRNIIRSYSTDKLTEMLQFAKDMHSEYSDMKFVQPNTCNVSNIIQEVVVDTCDKQFDKASGAILLIDASDEADIANAQKWIEKNYHGDKIFANADLLIMIYNRGKDQSLDGLTNKWGLDKKLDSRNWHVIGVKGFSPDNLNIYDNSFQWIVSN